MNREVDPDDEVSYIILHTEAEFIVVTLLSSAGAGCLEGLL